MWLASSRESPGTQSLGSLFAWTGLVDEAGIEGVVAAFASAEGFTLGTVYTERDAAESAAFHALLETKTPVTTGGVGSVANCDRSRLYAAW